MHTDLLRSLDSTKDTKADISEDAKTITLTSIWLHCMKSTNLFESWNVWRSLFPSHLTHEKKVSTIITARRRQSTPPWTCPRKRWTVRRQAQAARDYDDVDVTGDQDATSDDVDSPASPSPASSSSLVPATAGIPDAATGGRGLGVRVVTPGTDALLHHHHHHRAAGYLTHKTDSSIASEFTTNRHHQFGIDSLSVKLQETAAAAAMTTAAITSSSSLSSSSAKRDRSSSPVPSPPSITIPTVASSSLSTSVVTSGLCSSSTNLSLPYARPLVITPTSSSNNKGTLLLIPEKKLNLNFEISPCARSVLNNCVESTLIDLCSTLDYHVISC